MSTRENLDLKLVRFKDQYGFAEREIDSARWLASHLWLWAGVRAVDAFPGGGDNLTVTAYFEDGKVIDFQIRDDTDE